MKKPSRLASLAFTGLSALSLLPGCAKGKTNSPVTLEDALKPYEELFPIPNVDEMSFVYKGKMYIPTDKNKDGEVEVVYAIGRGSLEVYVTPDVYDEVSKEVGKHVEIRVIKMSPEMRERASKSKEATNSFLFSAIRDKNGNSGGKYLTLDNLVSIKTTKTNK